MNRVSYSYCQLSIQKPQTRLDWPPTRLPSRGNSDCTWPVVLPRRHGKLNGSRCWSLPTFVLLRKQRSLAKVNVTTPTIDLRCRASLKRSSLGFERPYWETMITRWLSSALLSPLLLFSPSRVQGRKIEILMQRDPSPSMVHSGVVVK